MATNINNTTGCNFSRPEYLQKISFKGYDARPLSAVVMTINDEPDSINIIKQMSDIGAKEGFRVYFTNQTNKLYANLDTIKKFFKICTSGFSKWAQDMAVLTPENRVLQDSIRIDADFARRVASLTKGKYTDCDNYIEGGNLFFVKNGDKEELFVGENELLKNSADCLKQKYGVSKVIPLPQADFHLDLFIRPLDNKRVLVTDDRLTIKAIKKAIENIAKYQISKTCTKAEIKELDDVKKGLKTMLKDFERDVKHTKNPKADEIVGVLKDNGYTPIMVPGRFYYAIPDKNKDDLVHSLNYMNAVVHKKNDGSLVFVTNKSNLNKDYGLTPEISEKIDFDFEKMFIKSVQPYIKKENIYFVEGTNNKIARLLETEGGGIHCLCNEIPAQIGQ